MDPRVVEHAKWLVNYCTSVKRGEQVLIRLGGADFGGDPEGLELATEVYKEVSRLGANPLILVFPGEAIRGQLELTPEEDLTLTPRNYYELVKLSDVIIAIHADSNTRFLEHIDPKRIGKRFQALAPLQQQQLKKTMDGDHSPH